MYEAASRGQQSPRISPGCGVVHDKGLHHYDLVTDHAPQQAVEGGSGIG
jgi:hypothetical protein